MQRQRRKLTVEVAIELRRKDGVRAIARELGRSPSVISAELGREPDGNYAAGPAQAAAAARWGTSGKAGSPRFAEVAKLLRLQPQQIAGKRLEDGTEVSSGLRVRRSTRRSTPGELRRELLACQGKPQRGRRTAGPDLQHHPRTPGGGGGCPGIGKAT